MVLVHAEVSATARPLVARTLGSLVEELAKEALDAFGKVERFGMGGMLQVSFLRCLPRVVLINLMIF